MFLEISQNSQENTCARASFLIKLQYRAPLVAACERNNFIQANAAKGKKSFFNISSNILIIYKEDKKSFFHISINIPAHVLNSNLHLVS